jgi:hypothetical protein
MNRIVRNMVILYITYLSICVSSVEPIMSDKIVEIEFVKNDLIYNIENKTNLTQQCYTNIEIDTKSKQPLYKNIVKYTVSIYLIYIMRTLIIRICIIYIITLITIFNYQMCRLLFIYSSIACIILVLITIIAMLFTEKIIASIELIDFKKKKFCAMFVTFIFILLANIIISCITIMIFE